MAQAINKIHATHPKAKLEAFGGDLSQVDDVAEVNNVMLPVLVTVNAWVAVAPSASEPKLADVGVMPSVLMAAMPVPLNATGAPAPRRHRTAPRPG